uniref:Fork-head domain-containing protein n=1 Tax=Angiostrongylus cantonensis TaxID=6313 RepID=A0A0K0CTM6_ANGCA
MKISKYHSGTMDDAMMSSSHEGGLSVLLSACAPPFNLDDDFGIGWNFLNDDKDEQNSLQTISALALNHSMLAQNSKCLSGENHCINYQSVLHFPFITVRKRIRDCSMVCWLFRTLLTSEYRALPLIAIFEIFENTNPSSAHGRHWRQSIRHCLMSSAAFVRVLTPNYHFEPRKDYVIMNEAGSWWTVHPDCEGACAEQVFRLGVAHKCPPNGSSEMIRPSSVFLLSSKSSLFKSSRTAPVNPQRGDNLVVDHEEEVIDFNPSP